MQPEGEPVDVPPPDVFGHDAGEDAGDHHAEKEARDDDGEGGGAAVGWSEITHEREHELRGYGADGGDEAEGAEDGEVVGDAETDPSRSHIIWTS